MKQPKKPTRDQKMAMSRNELNWKQWQVAKETDFYLYLVNKDTGKTKIIDKYKRK